MARRKKITEEMQSMQEKYQDLQNELAEIETKRADLETELVKHAEEACGEEYFCGVILSFDDVMNVLKLMMERNEAVRIPFKVYVKE